MTMPMWLADKWTELFHDLFDEKIRELKAHDPGFEAGLREQARSKADELLGINELKKQIETKEERMKDLRNEIERARKHKAEIVLGEEIEDLNGSVPYSKRREVARKIEELVEAEFEKLMREHPVGAEVMMLRKEKRYASGAVITATGPDALKDLFNDLTESLDVHINRIQELASRYNEDEVME